MSFKGLRIITNLHCNQRCTFCYQRLKARQTLRIETLKCYANMHWNKQFEYCTIMGGESTVLPDEELCSYIQIGAQVSKETRLTTNGSLVTPERLCKWKEAGLTGINISIPTISPTLFQPITGSPLNVGKVLNLLCECIKVFGTKQVRVNIPLCAENVRDPVEITSMLYLFLIGMKIKVTICEDVLRSYSVQDMPDKFHLTLKRHTGFGLSLYDFYGYEVGCYGHEDNYKHTDLIVSPVGVFRGWDDYCVAIGINKPL